MRGKIKSRNYKKSDSEVVIHINGFESEKEKALIVNQIRRVIKKHNREIDLLGSLEYKIKIG